MAGFKLESDIYFRLCAFCLLFYYDVHPHFFPSLSIWISHNFGNPTANYPKWVENKLHWRSSLKRGKDLMMNERTLKLPTKRKFHLKRKWDPLKLWVHCNRLFTFVNHTLYNKWWLALQGRHGIFKTALPYGDQIPSTKGQTFDVFQKKNMNTRNRRSPLHEMHLHWEHHP